ncbi:hypothetical protein GCM10022255_114450 [Dactylosporangium darangshiense]|uniref:OTU domain-containing protein n=2 Tax=Dactylosporangium darangshiense TaxID=579108 RepID=A0ABP8DVZ1_9ACTN
MLVYDIPGDGDCLFNAVLESSRRQGVRLGAGPAEPDTAAGLRALAATQLLGLGLGAVHGLVERSTGRLISEGLGLPALQHLAHLLLPEFSYAPTGEQVDQWIQAARIRATREAARAEGLNHDASLDDLHAALPGWSPPQDVIDSHVTRLSEAAQLEAYRAAIAALIDSSPVAAVLLGALASHVGPDITDGTRALISLVAEHVRDHGTVPDQGHLLYQAMLRTELWNTPVGDDLPRVLALALNLNIVIHEQQHEHPLPGRDATAPTIHLQRQNNDHYQALGPAETVRSGPPATGPGGPERAGAAMPPRTPQQKRPLDGGGDGSDEALPPPHRRPRRSSGPAGSVAGPGLPYAHLDTGVGAVAPGGTAAAGVDGSGLVSAVVGAAVAALWGWVVGVDDCLSRVGWVLEEVAARLGLPRVGGVVDDWSVPGSVVESLIVARLGGVQWVGVGADVAVLESLARGAVTAVRVERPGLPMHVVLVEREADGQLVMIETQYAAGESPYTRFELPVRSGDPGLARLPPRFKLPVRSGDPGLARLPPRFELPVRSGDPGLARLPEQLQGSLSVVLNDGVLGQLPPAPTSAPGSLSGSVVAGLLDPSVTRRPGARADRGRGRGGGGVGRGVGGRGSVDPPAAGAPSPLREPRSAGPARLSGSPQPVGGVSPDAGSVVSAAASGPAESVRRFGGLTLKRVAGGGGLVNVFNPGFTIEESRNKKKGGTTRVKFNDGTPDWVFKMHKGAISTTELVLRKLYDAQGQDVPVEDVEQLIGKKSYRRPATAAINNAREAVGDRIGTRSAAVGGGGVSLAYFLVDQSAGRALDPAAASVLGRLMQAEGAFVGVGELVRAMPAGLRPVGVDDGDWVAGVVSSLQGPIGRFRVVPGGDGYRLVDPAPPGSGSVSEDRRGGFGVRRGGGAAAGPSGGVAGRYRVVAPGGSGLVPLVSAVGVVGQSSLGGWAGTAVAVARRVLPGPAGMFVYDVAGDGDCLFNAVLESARRQGVRLGDGAGEPDSAAGLRALAAEQLAQQLVLGLGAGPGLVERSTGRLISEGLGLPALQHLLPPDRYAPTGEQVDQWIQAARIRATRDAARAGGLNPDASLADLQAVLPDDWSPPQDVIDSHVTRLSEATQLDAARAAIAALIDDAPAGSPDIILDALAGYTGPDVTDGTRALIRLVAEYVAVHRTVPGGGHLLHQAMLHTELWDTPVGDDLPQALAFALNVNIVVHEQQYERPLPGRDASAATIHLQRQNGDHYQALGPAHPPGEDLSRLDNTGAFPAAGAAAAWPADTVLPALPRRPGSVLADRYVRQLYGLPVQGLPVERGDVAAGASRGSRIGGEHVFGDPRELIPGSGVAESGGPGGLPGGAWPDRDVEMFDPSDAAGEGVGVDGGGQADAVGSAGPRSVRPPNPSSPAPPAGKTWVLAKDRAKDLITNHINAIITNLKYKNDQQKVVYRNNLEKLRDALIKHMNEKNGEIKASENELAAETKMPKKSVNRWIKRLIDHGLLKRVGGGQDDGAASRYRVVAPDGSGLVPPVSGAAVGVVGLSSLGREGAAVAPVSGSVVGSLPYAHPGVGVVVPGGVEGGSASAVAPSVPSVSSWVSGPFWPSSGAFVPSMAGGEVRGAGGSGLVDPGLALPGSMLEGLGVVAGVGEGEGVAELGGSGGLPGGVGFGPDVVMFDGSGVGFVEGVGGGFDGGGWGAVVGSAGVSGPVSGRVVRVPRSGWCLLDAAALSAPLGLAGLDGLPQEARDWLVGVPFWLSVGGGAVLVAEGSGIQGVRTAVANRLAELVLDPGHDARYKGLVAYAIGTVWDRRGRGAVEVSPGRVARLARLVRRWETSWNTEQGDVPLLFAALLAGVLGTRVVLGSPGDRVGATLVSARGAGVGAEPLRLWQDDGGGRHYDAWVTESGFSAVPVSGVAAAGAAVDRGWRSDDGWDDGRGGGSGDQWWLPDPDEAMSDWSGAGFAEVDGFAEGDGPAFNGGGPADALMSAGPGIVRPPNPSSPAPPADGTWVRDRNTAQELFTDRVVDDIVAKLGLLKNKTKLQQLEFRDDLEELWNALVDRMEDGVIVAGEQELAEAISVPDPGVVLDRIDVLVRGGLLERVEGGTADGAVSRYRVVAPGGSGLVPLVSAVGVVGQSSLGGWAGTAVAVARRVLPGPAGMFVYDVAGDGDCLFNAVLESARRQGVRLGDGAGEPDSAAGLRALAAEQLAQQLVLGLGAGPGLVERSTGRLISEGLGLPALQHLLPPDRYAPTGEQVDQWIQAARIRATRDAARAGGLNPDASLADLQAVLPDDWSPPQDVIDSHVTRLSEATQLDAARAAIAALIDDAPAGSPDIILDALAGYTGPDVTDGTRALIRLVAEYVAVHRTVPGGGHLLHQAMLHTELWDTPVGDDLPQALAFALNVNIVVHEQQYERPLPGRDASAATIHLQRQNGDHYQALGPAHPPGEDLSRLDNTGAFPAAGAAAAWPADTVLPELSQRPGSALAHRRARQLQGLPVERGDVAGASGGFPSGGEHVPGDPRWSRPGSGVAESGGPDGLPRNVESDPDVEMFDPSDAAGEGVGVDGGGQGDAVGSAGPRSVRPPNPSSPAPPAGKTWVLAKDRAEDLFTNHINAIIEKGHNKSDQQKVVYRKHLEKLRDALINRMNETNGEIEASSRELAKEIKAESGTVRGWIKALTEGGPLERVRVGTNGTHEASRYRVVDGLSVERGDVADAEGEGAGVDGGGPGDAVGSAGPRSVRPPNPSSPAPPAGKTWVLDTDRAKDLFTNHINAIIKNVKYRNDQQKVVYGNNLEKLRDALIKRMNEKNGEIEASSRELAKEIKADSGTVRGWIKALTEGGPLERVRVGTNGTHEASRYRVAVRDLSGLVPPASTPAVAIGPSVPSGRAASAMSPAPAPAVPSELSGLGGVAGPRVGDVVQAVGSVAGPGLPYAHLDTGVGAVAPGGTAAAGADGSGLSIPWNRGGPGYAAWPSRTWMVDRS